MLLSTWLSAAKLTTSSHPGTTSCTTLGSHMSPLTNLIRSLTSSRFSSLPAYVSLSRTTISLAGCSFSMCLTKLHPMNPAPPVMSILKRYTFLRHMYPMPGSFHSSLYSSGCL